MKVKHNKKRNTAFLFEALVREVTKSVVSNDKSRTLATKKILAEHFRKGQPLHSEIDCYRALVGCQGLGTDMAEKTLSLAKEAYKNLDPQKIFQEQSQVIKKINTLLDRSVYNNFVPNYKSFATIAQIFGEKAPLKNRVLMERQVVAELSSPSTEKVEMQPVDNLIVTSFATRFNEHYQTMLREQKDLLGKYIVSFGPNEIDFRVHVGRELKRLKEAIENSLEMEEVKEDQEMADNTQKVLAQLDEMNVSTIGERDILKILKIQKLVSEYQSDAN